MTDSEKETKQTFRLGWRFLGAWLLLWLILGSKLFIISEKGFENLNHWFLFGIAMLAAAYLGGLATWKLKKRNQLAGEIAYLSILALFFIVRTIFLYREALAASG